MAKTPVRGLLLTCLALVLPLGGSVPARGAGGVTSEVVVAGAQDPSSFAFFPDGRILYGERALGRIWVFDPADGSRVLLATIGHLATTDERGLLGVAIHPNFPHRPYIYAFATRLIDGVERSQIMRLRIDRPRVARVVIWTGATASSQWHNGGRILFGPDGMLYAVVGDLHDKSAPQDPTSSAGKVFRMTPRGELPPDNPRPDSLVYAYGFRNSFGMAFDPISGNLWETENGPECNDELNIVTAGSNYGWGPSEKCTNPRNFPYNTNRDGPDPVLPVSFFSPPIAPVGAAFCQGCGLPGAEGRLIFGAYATEEINMVTLTEDRGGVESVASIYRTPGGVRSVERAPDGTIYFSDIGSIAKLIETT